MRHKYRIVFLFLISIMAALLLPSVALAAGPIEPDRDTTFTISYMDGSTAIAGVSFDVYRCADVDAYGRMTLTADFASYPVSVDGLNQDGWQDLALTLKGYAQRDGLKVAATGTTDENGMLVLTLKPGLYLVVGSQQIVGDYTYAAKPFMVFQPTANETENTWDYEITSPVKYTRTENPPETISRKVLKIWEDNGYEFARPKEVIVQLLKNGKVSDTQTLNADNGWRYTWDGLNAEDEWTVVEKELDGYYTKVVQEGITFAITNKYVIPLTTDDPPVAKKITGDTPSSPSPFIFVLSAADVSCPMPAGSTGTMKEITIIGSGTSEFGQITFTKPGTYVYAISERSTGVEGYTYDTTVYTVRYTVTEENGVLSSQRRITEVNGKEADSPVFTNKYTKPGTKLPQTGMAWWPVPLLFSLGLLFYVVGFAWKKKTKR